MNQMSIVKMMNSIIPITRFNRGEANKIFDEVQSCGTKIVMKNNTPACVLISPGQYESLMEMLSDYQLLTQAQSRLSLNDDTNNLSHSEVLSELGISQAELDEIDVEIE